MSDKARQIFELIQPIEELRLKVFKLHDLKDLSPAAQSQIREAGSSLEFAKSELKLGAEKQAAHDFLKEVNVITAVAFDNIGKESNG